MTLVEWAQQVCAELELDDEIGKADVDRILDLTKDAAHAVARPAAPLTSYIVGIAVGRGADPVEAASAVAALARAQAAESADGS